jgi:capsular polysaccharide biosynthesis protein
VQPASYEPRFVRPQTAVNLALGLLLGLTGGVGLAVVADSRDRRLRTGDDVERKLGLAALGTIPQMRARQLAIQAGRRK